MIYLISKTNQLFLDSQTASMQEMLEWAESQNILSVDTETSGFFDFKNKLYTLQIGNKEDQFVIDAQTVDISPLKSLLEGDKLKLFHNYQFDGLFLFHQGIRVKNVWDTQVSEMCLTNGIENRLLDLSSLAHRICNKILNKEQRSKINGELTYSFIRYAAEDVEVLEDIYKDQLQRAKNTQLTEAIRLQNMYVQVLVEKKHRGIKLSKEKLSKLAETINNDVLRTRGEVDEWYSKIARRPVQTSLFHVNTGINWNSSKQVSEVFQSLGVNLLLDGKISVQEQALRIATKNAEEPVKKLTDKYLAYKQNNKLKTTYTDGYSKHINPVTGRIHPNFWQMVDTYRISSSNPNVMNIPARTKVGQLMRACFVPEEGNVFVNADFSAQEPRVLADKCQDPSLIEFFKNGGGDIHSMVATKMFTVINGKETIVTKDNENKELRQTGKILNLKLDYGGSAYTVKEDLNKTEKEAQKFIDALAQAFPEKEKYFKRTIASAMKTGYIEFNPVTKAKYFIPEYKDYLETKHEIDDCLKQRIPVSKRQWSHLYTLKGEIERKCKNYPIQGTSSDISKLAAVYALEEFYKQGINYKAWIVNEVHDEIIAECHKEIADQVAGILKDCMVRSGKIFCPTVPMVVEPEINLYWKK